jgi:hypothetical protein
MQLVLLYVTAKLMPKLEKSKELAIKIAKEVPKVVQAQAGKLQALQEDLQAGGCTS